MGNETRISILYARITRVHHLSKDDCNLWKTSTESHWISQGEENVNVGRGQLVYLALIRGYMAWKIECNSMQYNHHVISIGITNQINEFMIITILINHSNY